MTDSLTRPRFSMRPSAIKHAGGDSVNMSACSTLTNSFGGYSKGDAPGWPTGKSGVADKLKKMILKTVSWDESDKTVSVVERTRAAVRTREETNDPTIENTRKRQTQRGVGIPAHHHPGMVPVSTPPGVMPHPSMMYMMPTVGYYSCSPSSKAARRYAPSECYDSTTAVGSHVTSHANESFASLSSFDSLVCAAPCESIGRLIGNTVTAFLSGIQNTLDYNDNYCCKQAEDGEPREKENSLTAPTEAIATTPHPLPHPQQAHLQRLDLSTQTSEKMDELLRLMTEKDTSTMSGPVIAKGETIGATEGDVDAEVERAIRALNSEVICGGRNGEDPRRRAYADHLIGLARKLLQDRPCGLGGLNESAISKHSDVQGMTPHLELDEAASLTADHETRLAVTGDDMVARAMTYTQKKDDGVGRRGKLMFKFNSRDLSIPGAVEQLPGEEKKPFAKTVKKVEGRPPRPKTVALDVTNDAPKKPRRTQTMRQIFRDIKNAPIKNSRGHVSKKTTKRNTIAPKEMADENDVASEGMVEKNTFSPKEGTKETKNNCLNSFKITSNDCSNDSKSNNIPFVVDLSSGSVVDSMGFLVPLSQPCGYGNITNDNDSSWGGEFGGSVDNPFTCFVAKDANLSPDDARICAWCHTSGGDSRDGSRIKLKLCSRCQVKYYCSQECQLKDWMNGHALMCKAPALEATH